MQTLKVFENAERLGSTVSLLDNICFVAGCQGGVIHQWCDLLAPNYQAFKKEWQKQFDSNGMLMTKGQFVNIASRVDYEGLIWRPRKVEEVRLATFTPEAREEYFKSRAGHF